MKKLLPKYFCVFFGVLLLLIVLLWLSTKLPQENIDCNIEKSFIRLNSEGPYAFVLDGRPTSVLDNYTDSIILTVCKSSGIQNEKTFLTNPFFDDPDVLGNLGKYCAGGEEPNSFYVRYWLGFRIFLRPLFLLTDIQYIRYIIIVFMFSLFFLSTFSVCRNVSIRAGLTFFISIYLIRPYICARCLQYACCPLIAFLAILTVPIVEKKVSSYPIFFMVIGIITMFFDFYTVPILTFGLPMIYLMSIRSKNGLPMYFKSFFCCFAGWSVGYLLTWIIKLALVELFTEYDGFSNGFAELGMWLRYNPESLNAAEAYKQAFIALRNVIIPDTKARITMAALGTAVIATTAWHIKTRQWTELKNNYTTLIVGLIPLLWFAAATRPITSHAFFQYRSIAVTYWAIGAWIVGPKYRILKKGT